MTGTGAANTIPGDDLSVYFRDGQIQALCRSQKLILVAGEGIPRSMGLGLDVCTGFSQVHQIGHNRLLKSDAAPIEGGIIIILLFHTLVLSSRHSSQNQTAQLLCKSSSKYPRQYSTAYKGDHFRHHSHAPELKL